MEDEWKCWEVSIVIPKEMNARGIDEVLRGTQGLWQGWALDPAPTRKSSLPSRSEEAEDEGGIPPHNPNF